MSNDGLKIAFPVQGWKQFLTARKEMLDKFDSAREKAECHKVKTSHGNAAEADFRRWLAEFLPKRFGVTAGYVVSQGIKSDRRAPHFDVIVYDALNAPVLWIEDDSDTSPAGRSIAVPAEHVLGVLEVKAALTSTSAKEAVRHLAELKPLLQGVDDPGERHKLYLPQQFLCGTVFFELRKKDEYSEAALKAALEGRRLRGFLGGIVLRGEGNKKPASGRLEIGRSETPIESTIGRSKQSLLQSLPISESIQVADNLHLCTMLNWSESAFSQFAFDLLAIMQGTYEPGRLSTFHGMGTSDRENKPAQQDGAGNA